MTHSGELVKTYLNQMVVVLIPLLLDDPLWEILFFLLTLSFLVLIPLLLDDPLWVNAYKSIH